MSGVLDDGTLVASRRRAAPPQGPVHRRDARREVLPSDDQEDGQAGSPGSVHHEDRRDGSRLGPARSRRAGSRQPKGARVRRPRLKRTRESLDERRPATSTSCGPAERLRPRDRAAGRRPRARCSRRSTGRAPVDELEHEFGARAGARRARPAVRARRCSRTPRTTSAWRAREGARYDRQLRYFSDVSSGALPPSEYQRRLREARVLMLGVGGLGSWASYALAVLRGRRARAAGRRRGGGEQLQPADPLPRARHRPPEGRGRRGGARRVRLELPAHGRWRAGSRAWTPCARLAEGVDFVVNGADWPAHDIERWVNAACFEARRALHHDEPLAAGRARRPAVRARHHRLLRVPGADLPGRVPALRRAGRPAPRAARRRRPRSARCARSSAARWRSRRSTSSPACSRPPRSAWRTSTT